MEPKNIILKGTLDMFLKYGIKSITMDDISRALSISKKTIYQYFQDKDILVCECIQSFLGFQKESMDKISAESKDSIEELMKMSDFMKTHVCNISPTLIYDTRKYHQKAWSIFVNHKREHVETAIENTLIRGMKEGYFRPNLNAKILAKLRMESVEMAFNTEIFPTEEFEISKVQLEFFDQFIYGICTLKGHKLLNKYNQINEED